MCVMKLDELATADATARWTGAGGATRVTVPTTSYRAVPACGAT